MAKGFELLMMIVNNGYSDQVMDVARGCGAKGGTVISGRGTAKEETEKKFNIRIHPEKDIVLIVIPTTIKVDLMKKFYAECGTQTDAQGIAFTLPVEDSVGLKV